MKVRVMTDQELSIESLAVALAHATPKEFAEFWFKFQENVNDKELEEFAKAMAPNLGGLRKQPLKRLCRLMEYHEIQQEQVER